jgi:hypothetical protein
VEDAGRATAAGRGSGRRGAESRAVLVVLLAVVGLVATAPAARAQTPPEEIEYYATDGLGSVRALPRQRFTGQERDPSA